MEISDCPADNFVHNKCPGGDNIKCCLGAPYQEEQCGSQGGFCVDECGCDGETKSGYCPSQPGSIKCCIEEEVVESCIEEVATTVSPECVKRRRKRETGCSSEPSETCAAEGGYCGNPDTCPNNDVVHNKCPGGQDNK